MTMNAQRNCRAVAGRAAAALWKCDVAAELAEFALVLPFVIVIFVGIFDFGSAFTLRDKLTNGVREGARLAIRQGNNDLDQTAPASVQAIRDTVANYLVNAKVTTCALGTTPTKVGGSNGLAWTYDSSTSGPACSNVLLTIERAYTGTPTVTLNGATAFLTRVTLTYPYSFLSFHRAVTLVAPGATYTGTITLRTQSVMQNL
jgi:Flp pilus assembly protein TadG